MKKLIGFICAVALGINALAAVALSNVKIRQRYPWNGKVDISFNVAGTRVNNSITVNALDTATGKSLNVATLYDDNGNLISLPIKLTPGKHHLVWDANADVQVGYKTDSLAVTISAGQHYDLPLYQVVDLSGGPTAERFSITTLTDVPEGGWTKEYKTSKLVLRLVQPGRVHLGPFRLNSVSGEEADAIITKPFYIGLFKVTRKQWELVMGDFEGTDKGYSKEQVFNKYKGMLDGRLWTDITLDQCPITETPPKLLRGLDYLTKWPDDKTVAQDSFFGVLRRKTGLDTFDLPTEVEWEYVARAGTRENKELPFKGKDDIPNSWGLYEMMDDIAEVCIDGHYASYEEQSHGQVMTDPVGKPNARERNCRNYWVTEQNFDGIGQRMCIMNDTDSGGACPLSFRAGCFPFR